MGRKPAHSTDCSFSNGTTTDISGFRSTILKAIIAMWSEISHPTDADEFLYFGGLITCFRISVIEVLTAVGTRVITAISHWYTT